MSAACSSCCSVDESLDAAIDQMPIQRANEDEWRSASTWAAPPTRHTSRMAADLADSDDRSRSAMTDPTAATTTSISDLKSDEATDLRTSSWNSLWSFQIRPMMDALANRRPVSAATWSSAPLNVS